MKTYQKTGEIQAVNQKILKQLIQYLEQSQLLPQIKCVGGFYPLKFEVDCDSILKHFWSLKIKTALPLHSLNEQQLRLKFVEYTEDTELQNGHYGIKVPDSKSKLLIPDILLVPFLGFNQKLYRLGFGGGHYDRTIKYLKQEIPSFRAIGLGYDFQKREGLAYDQNDQ